ncbi:class I SAM-dependent methyltransferase [Actinomycetospora straminea]|uniref:Class I SAM-dependent methyltransferase n=1 Tax=Actinomycetospora straminea TaxID=663607 RepID=A0ABP9FFH8_9PSEU|nr:class I SAM-dependent methyltransferase [Actinomycetospora straminea]MDD7934811.1 class I SAM-dependent methyltransferase [Actinomycetospora straminea]
MSSPAASSGDHPRRIFSRFYAHISRRMEGEGMGALRTELLSPAAGEVVEIGPGNGLNFAHYPDAVTKVVAVEPEPHLRALAADAAREVPTHAEVVPGTAGHLPLATASVDTAVLCLVLCGIEDQPGALSEIVRVLRPGARLLFLEHTYAETAGLLRVQRLADATVWPLLTGGCRTSGDPVATITSAGFEVTSCRRLRFPEDRFTQPSSPHVLGAARRR